MHWDHWKRVRQLRDTHEAEIAAAWEKNNYEILVAVGAYLLQPAVRENVVRFRAGTTALLQFFTERFARTAGSP